MICGFLSIMLPLSDSPVEERKANESWRIIYGSPMVVEVFGIIFTCLFVKHPSLNELIQNDRKEEALGEIQKIYKTDNSPEQLEEVYNLIKDSMQTESKDISVAEALCSRKYRRATWNGIMITYIC